MQPSGNSNLNESSKSGQTDRETNSNNATMPAINQALVQIRFLQITLRKALQASISYESTLNLSKEAKIELKWWSQNLSLRRGRPITIRPPDMIIQSDAATSGGWGVDTQGWRTGGQWKPEEKNLHINEQELLAADLAIRTFTKWREVKSIHLQVDNTAAVSYILKQGGTKSNPSFCEQREYGSTSTQRKFKFR